jgi:transposase
MTSAYSQDFRLKVHAAIKEGIPAKTIASNFKIGIATVYRYIKHWKSGTLAPKKRTNYSSKVNLEEIKKYVEQNTDHTLKEIGMKFSLSASTVYRALVKLEISYKKKRKFIRKHVQ